MSLPGFSLNEILIDDRYPKVEVRRENQNSRGFCANIMKFWIKKCDVQNDMVFEL